MEMWAIKDTVAGEILPWSIRPKRSEAIEAIASPPQMPWKQLYRDGCRAVRVEVNEPTPPARMAA